MKFDKIVFESSLIFLVKRLGLDGSHIPRFWKVAFFHKSQVLALQFVSSRFVDRRKSKHFHSNLLTVKET